MRSAKSQLHIMLLFILLLEVAFLQQVNIASSTSCQNPLQGSLLQSGAYSLINQRGQNSRVHYFQVAVNYNIPASGFSVAVSTGRISGYNQAFGTDYSIRGGKLNSTNIANFILLINEDLSWTNIRASYLISSREDFFLGSFSPDTSSLFTSSDTNLLVQHSLNNWMPSQGTPSFIYLISGLRTSDNAFNITLTQAGFSTQKGLIKLQINTNANPSMEMIHITYIIFIDSAPFSISSYNPLNGSPQGDYLFEGVDSISQNSIIYKGFTLVSTSQPSITICIGSNCPSTCITPTKCTSAKGLIYLNKCFLCGFQEIFSSASPGQCLPRCPANQTWSGSACSCKNGYSRVNGTCRIANCGSNEIFNGTQCTCISGYQKINGICQIKCPDFSFWNGFECTCISGYVKASEKCSYQCTANGYLNDTGFCVCLDGYVRDNSNQCTIQNNCKTNEVFNSSQGKCVCKQGTLFSRNQCLIKCPGDFANAVVYQGTCVCVQGYDVVTGRCKKQITCTKVNQIVLNGQCACRSGYQYNSQGQCILNCVINQLLIEQACKCVTNYIRNSQGTCVKTCSANEALANDICQCVSGYARNTFGTCVRSCLNNQYLVDDTTCICYSGFSRNTEGLCVRSCGFNQYFVNTTCKCIPGFTRSVSGVCNIPVSNCGVNQVLSNKNICQCASGYIRRVSTQCISQCRVNQLYDEFIPGCVCKQGFGINPNNSLCDVCPFNSHSSGLLTGCICDIGYKWNSTLEKCEEVVCQHNSSLSQSGTCVCNTGFYIDTNQCKKLPSCPLRSIWNQAKLACVCDLPNEYLINGQCQVCQQNSSWNSTSCVCRTGYNLINKQCIQCSPNSQYIRGQCQCNFGYFGNGFTCTQCHSSCATCFNNSLNACLTCVNISYTLSNNICTLKQCDSGYFKNQTTSLCKKCIDYCDNCIDNFNCEKCAPGFEILRQNFGFSTSINCVQTCGDGRKIYDECDDGNNVSGDGCSSICKIQSGWTCVGGSSTSKSQCYNILPTASKIIVGGHVVLQGQVLQGISMTYLPQSLTNGGCPRCNRILNVSVINSPFVPVVSLEYVTASQYKFVIRFNFGQSTIGQFIFNFTVRISNSFSSYFTTADMQQVKIIQVDMALLARFQNIDTLNLNNLKVQEFNQNNANNKNADIYYIPGVSQSAIDILFPIVR